MAKLTLTPITSAYQAITALNANNALIEAAMENTLSRDGTTPNTMSANLDINSYKILNSGLAIAGSDIPTYQQVIDLLAAAGSAAIATPIAATLVTITDAGGYYTAIEVESALQELMTGQGPVGDGTVADSVLRWDGSQWVENPTIIMSSSSVMSLSGAFYINAAGFLEFDDFTSTSSTRFVQSTGRLLIQGTSGTPWVENEIPLRQLEAFYLAEQAAAFADLSTYGQLWVRNDTNQTLMFTDEAGDDYEIGGDAIQPLRVTTPGSTQQNNIVLTDDPDLVITLDPGDYIVEGYINWSQSGGGGNGIQMRLNVNSGAVSNATGALIQADQVAVADGASEHLVLDIGGSTRAITKADLDNHRGHYRGVVTVDTTAEIAFQWAQNVSHSNPVGIGAGFLTFTPITGGF